MSCNMQHNKMVLIMLSQHWHNYEEKLINPAIKWEIFTSNSQQLRAPKKYALVKIWNPQKLSTSI